MNDGIKIVDLNKSYGRKPVLTNVNLELTQGKIIGLCGPNGAGKTTLIKILVGLIRSYDGTVLIDQEEIGERSKAKVSYLSDMDMGNLSDTGLRVARFYQDMYEDFDLATMEDLFIRMKLDGNMPLSQMSKGMREKFQLALCLSRHAQIYILDEPLAAVDPASRDSIIETILNTYSRDALLIISTHLIQDVETILDEVIFLKEGSVLFHKNCDDLREEHNVSIDALFREVFKW